MKLMDEQIKNVQQDSGLKYSTAMLTKTRQLIESAGVKIPGMAADGIYAQQPYEVLRRKAQWQLTRAQLATVNKMLPGKTISGSKMAAIIDLLAKMGIRLR